LRSLILRGVMKMSWKVKLIIGIVATILFPPLIVVWVIIGLYKLGFRVKTSSTWDTASSPIASRSVSSSSCGSASRCSSAEPRIELMYPEVNGRFVTLRSETGRIVRKFSMNKPVVSAQVSGDHVVIQQIDGRTYLYKSSGLLVRKTKS
jgi:hypothetical protein